MNRQNSESANHAAQDQRFPLTSDIKNEEQSVRTNKFVSARHQNQKTVRPPAGSRLDELISEEDIEWGE